MHSQALLLREFKGIASRRGRKTGLSPSMALHSEEDFSNIRKYKELHTPQFGCDPIRLGLFPLRSPLLRESQLFSFPPLNDMLKFSGWSITAQALKSKNRFCNPQCLRAYSMSPTQLSALNRKRARVKTRPTLCVQRFDNTLDSAIHTTLSHIAASFIDWGAKTSTVMSCAMQERSHE